MLNPGTIIGTRYKVIRLLGQGGMSNIYVCQELTTSGAASGQIWAVKEFTATYADPHEQEAALANFRREAYLLHQLSHPHLPTIREYFQFQGKYYLAMEYLQGSDLGKILEQAKRPLPELKVADLGLQMTTVLYYLHCQKPTPIIFRDVKPSNIILCGDTVKLIDFGIARLFTPGKRGDTMRIGSPGYAPPEQYNGQTDLRSDIYALGMTLHQCLTGQDPTLSPNPFVVTPVLDLNPQVSPELAVIIQKAIKLIPEERYQSMLEMKGDLRRFLRSRRGSDSSILPSAPPKLPVGSAPLGNNSTPIPSSQISPAASVASTTPSSAPVLPIPPFIPATTQNADVSLPSAATVAPHKGGTSIVTPLTTHPHTAISTSANSSTASASGLAPNRSNAATVPNFGPPVIIPVDDDEVPGTWKKKIVKIFMILATWSLLGAACSVVFGLYPIEIPNLHEPFNSRRASLCQSITPSKEDLSSDNYRSVYKYTLNRLKAAEILNSRVQSAPHDFVARALKQNLDILLSERHSSFVGNAEYEKLYKGDLNKIESFTDPSGLYLDSQTQSALLGPMNTISLVLPEAKDPAQTDFSLARGALAAQEVLQNCANSQGKGVMINPILNSRPLSSADLVQALNGQLCQAAPIPKNGHLNSQIVISGRDISYVWSDNSRTVFSLTPQLQAPDQYFDLSKNDKQPGLAAILSSSVNNYAKSGSVFILKKDFACKFTDADTNSLPKNCRFINNWQELSNGKYSGGLVLLSPAQLKADLSVPPQYKVALLTSTPEAANKLRASLPKEWLNSRRLSVWSLISYQHPNRQALTLLNSPLLDEQTTADITKLYKTLKAADAFTLGALYLRQAQDPFHGALADYNLENGTFIPISCQAFTMTAHGFSPVASPSQQSQQQGTLKE